MSTQAPSEAAVEAAGLRFGYDRENPVIDIADLSVAKAEKVFLFGPSGSGKSTLLSLIGGVLSPNSGEISVLGQPMSRMRGSARDRYRADHIGFVFQQFNLVPYLSVADNVCLPCRFSKRRLARAEKADGSMQASASRLLRALAIDPSFDTRKATDLSVGQQQRVAVARALIGQPELVIADEPTSALDTDRRENFIELLLSESERSGCSVVFVSHDRGLSRYFDRAIDLQAVNAIAEETADA